MSTTLHICKLENTHFEGLSILKSISLVAGCHTSIDGVIFGASHLKKYWESLGSDTKTDQFTVFTLNKILEVYKIDIFPLVVDIILQMHSFDPTFNPDLEASRTVALIGLFSGKGKNEFDHRVTSAGPDDYKYLFMNSSTRMRRDRFFAPPTREEVFVACRGLKFAKKEL